MSKEYVVVYLVGGYRDQLGSASDLESAMVTLRMMKRRGRTAWIEDTAGNFVPVNGAKGKPAELTRQEKLVEAS